ncbi:hypothetical protein [Pelagibaculum spongiae]|uniref:Uncharacterized protein n=1 Tax=Pelagibaculum spongiae TaxID=2080658 RepID=A0A2V1GZC6_9GAMM|nr:hypothetical protein [Pelagibaculum spongiae]PVZ68345.1 hypothetical protein DC094_13755 [Pelagibaculum spongiae]
MADFVDNGFEDLGDCASSALHDVETIYADIGQVAASLLTIYGGVACNFIAARAIQENLSMPQKITTHYLNNCIIQASASLTKVKLKSVFNEKSLSHLLPKYTDIIQAFESHRLKRLFFSQGQYGKDPIYESNWDMSCHEMHSIILKIMVGGAVCFS